MGKRRETSENSGKYCLVYLRHDTTMEEFFSSPYVKNIADRWGVSVDSIKMRKVRHLRTGSFGFEMWI